MSTWFKQVANNSLSYLNAQIEPLRHRQKYGKTLEEIIFELQSELQITISREKDVERKIETEEQHRKKIRSKHQELNFRVQNLDENRQFLFKQTADYECKLEKQAQKQRKLLMAMDTLNTQLVGLDNIKLRSAELNLKGATELAQGTLQKLPKLEQRRQQLEQQLRDSTVGHAQCSQSIEELTHKRESLRSHLNEIQQKHQRLTQKRDSLQALLHKEQERLTAKNGNELVEVLADDDANDSEHTSAIVTESDRQHLEFDTIFESTSQTQSATEINASVASSPAPSSPSMQSMYATHKALNEEIASTATLLASLHRELNACEKRVESEHVQLGKVLLQRVKADKEAQRMRDMIELQRETLSSIEQSVDEYAGKQQQCLQRKAHTVTKLESFRNTLGGVKLEMGKYRDDIQAIREASNSLSQKKFDLASKLKRTIDKENEVEEELKILHRNRMSLRSRKAQLVKQYLSLQEQSRDANAQFATQTATVIRFDCDTHLLSKKQKQKQKAKKEQQHALCGQLTVSKECVAFVCDSDSRFDLKHELIDVSHSSLTNYSSTTQHPMLLLHLVQGVAYHGGHRYLAHGNEAIDNCYQLQIESGADKNTLLLMHNLLLAKQDLMDKVHSLHAQHSTDAMDKVHRKHSSIFSIHDIEIEEEEVHCHCSSPHQLRQIISLCPSRTHISKWKLFYSTAVHGISMNTLYANCESVSESLLVIRDSCNHIFGAFISFQGQQKWTTATDYRGTMDCFVFQLAEHHAVDDDDTAEHKDKEKATEKETDDEDNSKALVYRASGQQSYFIRNDFESITVGAGECPAIYIDSDLNIGRSTKCTTFNSPCLVSTTPFQITTLEIWGYFL